ncbi:hypothetical protein JCM1841_000031 [Sporobolomyces salmonicolor]
MRRVTPVSLALTATLPAPGTTVLPPAIAHALPPPPGHGHRPSASTSSMTSSHPHPHPHPHQTANPANQTRILLLCDFSPSLKTRDLQDALAEWEGDRGGFKVKWRDDTSAWVVFGDPAVAKRAFLSLITQPPAALQSTTSDSPSIYPYTGPDVPQILQAVQNRPRSHSVSGQGGGHSRKGSLLGSGGGTALGQSQVPAAPAQVQGHSRNPSWGRTSLDRRAAKDILEGAAAAQASSVLPVPAHLAREQSDEWRSTSPTEGGEAANGVVAGETARKLGGGGAGQGQQQQANGHRKSGSDTLPSGVAGLTINE